MATHSSARLREEVPHVNNTNNQPISDALRRRALSVINNKSIDANSRAIIRYGLETNDPWLADLVRRVDAGESIIDETGHLHIAEPSNEEKIEELTEMICQTGDRSAVALLVLMAMLENAPHPKALANQAKHIAFARCGKLNLFGMVDAQIATLEDELFERNAEG